MVDKQGGLHNTTTHHERPRHPVQGSWTGSVDPLVSRGLMFRCSWLESVALLRSRLPRGNLDPVTDLTLGDQ